MFYNSYTRRERNSLVHVTIISTIKNTLRVDILNCVNIYPQSWRGGGGGDIVDKIGTKFNRLRNS
jgi:hypothetical protein